MSNQKNKLSLKEMILCGIFAALTAIMAQIRIYTPFSTAPITLQTLAVFLSAAVLGSKKGAISLLIYILLGITGIPVFSNFKGGPSVIAGPTGGYIISFPIIALVVGLILENRKRISRINMFGAMVVGLLICYIIGTVHLALVSNLNLIKAITAGVITFLPFDIIKLFIAAFLGYEIRHALERAGLLQANETA